MLEKSGKILGQRNGEGQIVKTFPVVFGEAIEGY